MSLFSNFNGSEYSVTEDMLEDNICYTYKGLDNNTFYYIRCMGATVNGMELDTGYVEIHIKYEKILMVLNIVNNLIHHLEQEA